MLDQKTKQELIPVKITGDTFWKDLEIVKSCHGRIYENETKLWWIPPTEGNIEILANISYIKPQIDLFLERKKLSTQELDVESRKLKLVYPFLFDFQAVGSHLCLNKKKFLIADEMGLGKTIQCMPIIDDAIKNGKKIIILAPSSLLKQWQREIQRFVGYESLIIRGLMPKTRFLAYKSVTNKIILCTYETFWRDVKRINVSWDKTVIICDEASKFKNRKTKIWESMKEICEYVDTFIALSGTPIENSLVNFFNIISVIKPGFMSPKEFYYNYCIWDNNPFGASIIGYKNLDEFLRRVSPLMIRRRKSDVTQLPEKIIQDRLIPLMPEQEQCIEGLRAFASSEKGNIAVMVLSREVANDTYLLDISTSKMVRILQQDGFLPTPIEGQSNKLMELKDIFDEIDQQKVLIFTMFSRMAKKIQRELEEIGRRCKVLTGDDNQETRDKVVEEFKNGKFQILVATEIFGYGMNLQFVDILINFDLPWNPAKLNQRIDRIHRIGSKNAKVIINLISEDIDERVKEVLESKQNLFDQVVNGQVISEETVRQEILQKLLKRM